MRTYALAFVAAAFLALTACSTQGEQGGNPYATGESASSPGAIQQSPSGGGGSASSADSPM